MINMITKVKPGVVVKHKSGSVYTVLKVVGTKYPDTDFTDSFAVQYIGANGNYWERELNGFCDSMTILFDGTNKAN